MSFIQRVDQMPEQPETLACIKHGDYQVRYVRWGTKGFLRQDTCPECNKAQEAERERERLKEEAERQAKILDNYRRQAGISARLRCVTFDDFVAETPAQQKALDACRTMAEQLANNEPVKSLILCGGIGTGKTHLASAIIEHVIDKRTCRLVRAISILRRIKESWKSKELTESRAISEFVTPDLLIIDEVGIQFGSETERLLMFDVIDGRYRACKPTMLISNLGVEALKESLGEQVVDRLREDGGTVIPFDWQSYRGRKVV